MGMREEHGQIILTGKTSKEFMKRVYNPNKEVMKKRDAFLKHIKNTLKVEKRGTTTIVTYTEDDYNP